MQDFPSSPAISSSLSRVRTTRPRSTPKTPPFTAASDSLGSVSLTGYEIVKLVKASRACSEMALSAFESYIVEVIAEAVAAALKKYIFTGTGTNQPGGVKTAG